MTNRAPMTVPLGDLVAAVFDQAAHYVSDPTARARLAARTVRRMLRTAERLDHESLARARHPRMPLREQYGLAI